MLLTEYRRCIIAGIDQYTKLLLHCDGADASTTFTDSATGKAITAVGTAQVDTAQSKFGGASLLLNGNSDYLSVADSDDFYFDGNFTIDFWVRWAGLPASNNTMGLFTQYVDASHYIYFLLYNNAGAHYDYSLEVYDGTQKVYTLVASAATPSINTWYHIAMVRNGNDFLTFQDGVQCGATVTDADPIPNFAAPFLVGYGLSTYHNGWLDEIRISKGIARWTGNFTPPLQPYSRMGGALPFFL